MVDLDKKFCRRLVEDGSTCVFALVTMLEETEESKQKGEDAKACEILCVNVGDSRCILGLQSQANGFRAMSHDHKPRNPEEMERIENCGGFVSMDNRVDGRLALSRAFGDKNFKDSIVKEWEEQKVIPVPDFEKFSLTKRELKDPYTYLALYCDGLVEPANLDNVDMHSLIHKGISSQLVDLKKKDFKKERGVDLDPYPIVESMLEKAADEGSGDNMSSILVFFQDGTSYKQDKYRFGPLWPHRLDKRFVQDYKQDAAQMGYDEKTCMMKAFEYDLFHNKKLKLDEEEQRALKKEYQLWKEEVEQSTEASD